MNYRMKNPKFHGKVISERYQLEHKIGQGGQAWVYQAHDVRLDRPVAVKILKKYSRFFDYLPERERRFEQEAHMTARLTSEHTVTLFDYGNMHFEGERYLFMVTELVEGSTLRFHVNHHGALSTLETVSVLAQIARSLHEAHTVCGEGFIHRNLTTANVMVEEREGELQAKVLDFGIGKALQEGSRFDHVVTEEGEHLMSPWFAAPEQLDKSRGGLGPWTDLYALGLIAYYCLVGEHAYIRRLGVDPDSSDAVYLAIGELLNDSLVRLPAEFDGHPLGPIVHKLLEKDISRRYQSSRELLRDLESLTSPEPAPRHNVTRRRVLEACVLALLVVSTGLALQDQEQGSESASLLVAERAEK